LATNGVWEPHVSVLFRRLLKPNDVCVDVGANTGYYSLLASRIVGPGGHVYAIEPALEAYSLLVENVELNGLRNVTPLQIAAGATSGHVHLHAGDGGDIRSTVIAPDADADVPSGVRVPMSDVPAVVPPAELDRLRMVKIDVEGYEVEVLRGLVALYQRSARPSILVELHTGAIEPALEILAGLGQARGLRLYDIAADGVVADVSARPVAELAGTLEGRYERHLLLSAAREGAVTGE
jgi:FkbM family methyltransferase